ncbi:MAG: hypothetical protein JKY44_04440 [Flavobacteriaceae bacterium]|nr:hypothetical protein [Flavobacteriaceae bacterium]
MNLKTKNYIPKNNLSNSIVNLDYITEYLDGEKEPTIKVIRIFLEQASKIMKRLEEGVLSKNHQEITYSSRFFKTSFITMGINCYKEVCEIEDLSRQNNSVEKISRLLSNMMPAFNEAIHEYKLLLEKLQSQ